MFSLEWLVTQSRQSKYLIRGFYHETDVIYSLNWFSNSFLTDCKSDNSKNIDLGKESEYDDIVNELEDVDMKLNRSTYASEGDKFKVTVENNSEEEVYLVSNIFEILL